MPYASVSPAFSFDVPQGMYRLFVRIEPFASHDFLHPIGTSVSPTTGVMTGRKVGGRAMGVRFTLGMANRNLFP